MILAKLKLLNLYLNKNVTNPSVNITVTTAARISSNAKTQKYKNNENINVRHNPKYTTELLHTHVHLV